MTTLAGLTNTFGKWQRGRNGSAAGFGYLDGVTVDALGIVYVVDTSNNTIRKVTPAGVVTTLAGWQEFAESRTGPEVQRGLIAPLAWRWTARNRLRGGHREPHDPEDSMGGEVTTLAGLAQCCNVNGNPVGGNVDAYGTAARFSGPLGVAVDNGATFMWRT